MSHARPDTALCGPGRDLLGDRAKITLQPPTWHRVSLCRVPTPRDALWKTPGKRPDESGVPSGPGRPECLRHMAHSVNVKLFLRSSQDLLLATSQRRHFGKPCFSS